MLTQDFSLLSDCFWIFAFKWFSAFVLGLSLSWTQKAQNVWVRQDHAIWITLSLCNSGAMQCGFSLSCGSLEPTFYSASFQRKAQNRPTRGVKLFGVCPWLRSWGKIWTLNSTPQIAKVLVCGDLAKLLHDFYLCYGLDPLLLGETKSQPENTSLSLSLSLFCAGKGTPLKLMTCVTTLGWLFCCSSFNSQHLSFCVAFLKQLFCSEDFVWTASGLTLRWCTMPRTRRRELRLGSGTGPSWRRPSAMAHIYRTCRLQFLSLVNLLFQENSVLLGSNCLSMQSMWKAQEEFICIKTSKQGFVLTMAWSLESYVSNKLQVPPAKLKSNTKWKFSN